MTSPFALQRIALLAAAVVAVSPVAAADPVCRAQSGRQTVALVELYTSEGCDSCPPADRWLSSTFPAGESREGPALATAIAFHVDYWDRLGWKDRFATPGWTKRQYDSARAARSDLVYTPQVLLQGRDLRDWHAEKRSAAAIAAVDGTPARADIALEVAPQPGAVVVNATAHVPGAANRKGAALFVALTEDGLASEVKAGENKGKRLVHDHVVRDLRGDIAIGSGGDGTGRIMMALPAEAGKSSTIVAFVQNVDTGDVLQTLSLPLSAACLPPR
jgi:hypothetical protein